MASNCRKVCVSFISLKCPTRKKCVILPPYCEGTSDLVELRRKLFTEMLLDQSIIQLGGTSKTKIDNVVIYRYDETFEEEIELNSNDVLVHGDKNLVVKIHNFVKLRRPRTVIDGDGLIRTPFDSEFNLLSFSIHFL